MLQVILREEKAHWERITSLTFSISPSILQTPHYPTHRSVTCITLGHLSIIQIN